ncbi:hypothetical protein [Pseudolysinimonas sp.]|jgi:hypothetical protein|uniref:hypothetical protein n=1 Tax=Pseudolysinimonas sp. TaxID=2680009 RepID=UPI0037851880
MRTLLSSPNRIVALALGAGYAPYGVFAVATGRPLLAALFEIGAVALILTAARGIAPARVANIAVGTAWLALGYAGLFLVGTAYNVLGLGAVLEVGLFAAAVIHLAVGLGARRDVAAVTPADPTPSEAATAPGSIRSE